MKIKWRAISDDKKKKKNQTALKCVGSVCGNVKK